LEATTLFFDKREKKIIVRVMGGIGNQLFCYAAARRLALVNDAELVIDDVSGFARDTYRRHYQLDRFNIPCRKATAAERLEPFPRVRRRLMQQRNRNLPFEKRSYLMQEVIDFDPRLLQVEVEGTLIMEGYWQSENYFTDVEETIREELQIQPPRDRENLEMAAKIDECRSIAVHVRFFNAPGRNGINNAPSDYYRRALERMESMVPDCRYFVFSDRPEAARELVPFPEPRTTSVAHNRGDDGAYADLWLMSRCKHFIIANSTFSWWGAWLSSNADKVVIAPGFELREGVAWWGFDGLLPDAWIQC
jgi:Glycosyl transferase family 11